MSVITGLVPVSPLDVLKLYGRQKVGCFLFGIFLYSLVPFYRVLGI